MFYLQHCHFDREDELMNNLFLCGFPKSSQPQITIFASYISMENAGYITFFSGSVAEVFMVSTQLVNLVLSFLLTHPGFLLQT